jgi:hypothetical protein
MLLLAYMIEEKYILNLQQIPGLERQEIEYEIQSGDKKNPQKPPEIIKIKP